MKRCKTCGKTKPAEQFYPHAHTRDRLNYRCIACQNAYNKAYNLRKRLETCDPEVLRVLADMPMDRLRRFAPKISVAASGCWEWNGNRHPDTGYGRFWLSRHTDRLAHRLSYEAAVGPIPDGMNIDHLCRVRHCVNPAHLDPTTPVENVMRGMSAWAINARKTHCKRGHEFTDENTYLYKGMRHCRECMRIRKRERRRRLASERPPAK